MFVLIAGGGRTGTELAHLLLEQNHQVKVVEHRTKVLAMMHRDLPTEIIFQGNPTEPDVLEQAGIREAQVVAACLAEDEDNLIVCYLARQMFSVGRTVARINNPRNAWLFDDKFHVDVSVNHCDIMAHIIEEEVSFGKMTTLLKVHGGDYSIIEDAIAPGAPCIGIPLKDLQLPDNCVIAAILRNNHVVVPRGESAFEQGDEILAVTNREGALRLSELFSTPG